MDVESLLQPVSHENPGGDDLRSSLAFTNLERGMQGKPEQQIGDRIEPAEPPAWNAILGQSIALLGQSKILRASVFASRALLATQGLAGLAEGFALARGLVERFWDTLHPRLDTDNDPIERISAMTELVHRETVVAVRSVVLVGSRRFGNVTMREIEAATKAGPSSEAAIAVDGAFREVPPPELEATANAATKCVDELALLEAAWTGRVLPLGGHGPDFAPLRKILVEIQGLTATRLRERVQAAATNGHPAGDAASAAGAVSGGAVAVGDLRSREDVIRALDGMCAYFARNEPSSPVPLLLERCKRLVKMSFVDIVKDMIPDGLSTVETIAGKQQQS
ncbi:MAG TPA: type VI secretion system protein TssA, partial [Polyangiaceae bacterium]|nr:type VI secretion system protein TssA [Polyangiaceae bacterium]